MSSDHVIVVEKRSDFRWPDSGCRVVTAEEFIAGATTRRGRSTKVINLCRNYDYQGTGYYCSLLAEARDERITPSMETIVELQQRAAQAPALLELSRSIGALEHLPRAVSQLNLHVYFGHSDDAEFAELARASFERFQCPLLEITLEHAESSTAWQVSTIRALDPRDVEPSRDAAFIQAFEAYTRRNWRPAVVRALPRMDLAVLHDPQDPLPPSNLVTLNHLVDIGRDMNVAVELIERKDYSRLTQFDALFIRETTAVSHHTFKFAKKAQSAGMPVIDDPQSILRCTNKAFLAELLHENAVATPRTRLVTRRNIASLEDNLSFPVVLKVPDGAFSRSVKKAEDWGDFLQVAHAMLKESAIILAQEFMYTPFDWRVGVLDGEAIFAARYFMCGGHWQIIKHEDAGDYAEGRTEAVSLAATPKPVIDAAVRSAGLLGTGLYGVDLKEHGSGVYVIEINDNPNIDIGAEDAMVGDQLYVKLIEHLLVRHERRHVVAPSSGIALPGKSGFAPMLKKARRRVAQAASAGASNLQ